MAWSPDNRWIIHYAWVKGEHEMDGSAMPQIQSIWAARVDGEEVRLLEELSRESVDERVMAWTSSESFVTTSWEGDGIGSMYSHIRELNIHISTTLMIYEGRVESADFSAEPQSLVFTQGRYSDKSGGIFLVNAESLQVNKVDDREWDEIWWIPETQWFTASNWDEDRVSIFTEQGTLVHLFSNEVTAPIVSLDGNWFVFWSENTAEQHGLRIYDKQGDLVNHILPDYRFTGELYWKPDSSEFWFIENCDFGFGNYRDIFEYNLQKDIASRFDVNLEDDFDLDRLIGLIPAQK
jgi:hypothetical protein